MGPPKSVVLICLNVIPYTFLSPIAQYLFVAQSGGAPNTNVLAIVCPPPPADVFPPPPDELLPHAPRRSVSASTAAPRAYLRHLRMGFSPFVVGAAEPPDRDARTLSALADGAGSGDQPPRPALPSRRASGRDGAFQDREPDLV